MQSAHTHTCTSIQFIVNIFMHKTVNAQNRNGKKQKRKTKQVRRSKLQYAHNIKISVFIFIFIPTLRTLFFFLSCPRLSFVCTFPNQLCPLLSTVKNLLLCTAHLNLRSINQNSFGKIAP